MAILFAEKGAVKFESDASALQSILHNRGLTASAAGGVVPARQTMVAQRPAVAVTPSHTGRTTVSHCICHSLLLLTAIIQK